MDEKVVLSLVSVGFGWFIAQATSYVKVWWLAKNLRSGLLMELEDIQDQLQRVVLIHTRHLQIFGLKGAEATTSLPVSNMFFKQYFKDAFPYLNREQRISYQLIHSSLDELNEKSMKLGKFVEDKFPGSKTSSNDDETLKLVLSWGDKVTMIYKSTMILRWHIAYHLENRDRPKFDILGPMHESYLKFEDELNEKVKTILEKA